MSYDEEQQRRSRVVVDTPTARREEVHYQRTRYPQPDRSGYSVGIVATVALVAIAATAIFFLFFMNPRDDSSTNVNVRTTAPPEPTPYVVQQPVIVPTPMTEMTPIIIQPPPTITTAPPVVIEQPPPVRSDAPTTTQPPSAAAVDDTALETGINKVLLDDSTTADANIDVRVVNGKAILTGSVNSDDLKRRAERLAYSVKGVRSVENRITVSAGTP